MRWISKQNFEFLMSGGVCWFFPGVFGFARILLRVGLEHGVVFVFVFSAKR